MCLGKCYIIVLGLCCCVCVRLVMKVLLCRVFVLRLAVVIFVSMLVVLIKVDFIVWCMFGFILLMKMCIIKNVVMFMIRKKFRNSLRFRCIVMFLVCSLVCDGCGLGWDWYLWCVVWCVGFLCGC